MPRMSVKMSWIEVEDDNTHPGYTPTKTEDANNRP